MNERKFYYIIGSVVFLIAILSLIILMSNNGYEIANPNSEEVDYIIQTNDCTNWKLLNSTFLIPEGYRKAQRTYTEQINETHGRYCWYDVYKEKELNNTWLDDNCNSTRNIIFQKKYTCEKGFEVQ